jgi:hypothetical protein
MQRRKAIKPLRGHTNPRWPKSTLGVDASALPFQIPIRSTSSRLTSSLRRFVQAGCFRIRAPGHALRDLDTAAIGQVIGYCP